MNGIEKSIQEGIQSLVNEARERTIQVAVKTFADEVRRIVCGSAVNIANYYSIQRMGTDLVITVKMEDSPEPPK